MSEQASNKAGNEGCSVTVALPTRVLVCGGRDFSDQKLMFDTLDRVDRELPRPGITHLISGCASGADTLSMQWSRKWDLPIAFFPARWREHGNAAGPIRNQQMIDEGKPDMVVAFPGGRGTADMVRRAKAAGIKVIEVQAESPSLGVPVRG